ncbi:ABC transporter [Vibrio sp. F13]|uniref:ABC transporter permease n=1 Tax=Vibrio sp. F13 TaxID=2070777 RepID=UPI0010BD1DC6|nr:ABC transporter permease [Vibrio sp. F13]TKF67362.1 ABC transporter [Vibrio sp. F13]
MAKLEKRSTLHIWGDVIFAIFLREVKSKSTDKLGIAWSVISPVVFIFILSYFRGQIDGGETHGIPTFYFMVFGMVQVQLFLSTLSATSNSIKKNKPLYAFRQVQPISSLIAISGLEFLVKVFVILILSTIAYIMRVPFYFYNPLEVITLVIRVWLLATSLGLLCSLATCFIPEIDKLRSLAMRPMFFLSGIFYSLQDIPIDYRVYLVWNPILHAVELTRQAAYPNYITTGLSDFYINSFTLFCLFISLACYKISWKQAISR